MALSFDEWKKKKEIPASSAVVPVASKIPSFSEWQSKSTVPTPATQQTYSPQVEQAVASLPETVTQQPKKTFLSRTLDSVKNVALENTPVVGDVYRAFKFQKALDPVLQPLIDKTLNTDTGKKIAAKISKSTEDLPLKGLAVAKSVGSGTYDEEMQKLVSKRNDETNSWLEKVGYELQSAAPQSLIGVALSLIPYAGKPLASGYFGTLSAASQIEERGNVDSAGNIVIDVVGDRILGDTLSSLLKKGSKELVKTGFKELTKQTGKAGLIEGGTEVAQSILKYANDYQQAKTATKRDEILQKAKDYVVNGGLVMEFVVGGLSGAGIGAGASALTQTGAPKRFFTATEGMAKEVQDSFKQEIQNDLKTKKPDEVASEITKELPIDLETANAIVSEVAGTQEITPESLEEIAQSIQSQPVAETVEEIPPVKPKTAPEQAIAPKTDMQQSISKAKASGQSFDEWVKGQEPSTKPITLKTKEVEIKDLYAHGEPELKDAIRNVESGAVSRTKGIVEVTQKPTGEVVVLDGQHRVVEAIKRGETKIKINVVPYEDAINPEFGYTVRNLITDGEPVPFKTHSQLKAEWDRVGKQVEKSVRDKAITTDKKLDNEEVRNVYKDNSVLSYDAEGLYSLPENEDIIQAGRDFIDEQKGKDFKNETLGITFTVGDATKNHLFEKTRKNEKEYKIKATLLPSALEIAENSELLSSVDGSKKGLTYYEILGTDKTRHPKYIIAVTLSKETIGDNTIFSVRGIRAFPAQISVPGGAHMLPSSQAGKPAGNGLARLSIGQEQKSKREGTKESIPLEEKPVKKGKSRAFERVRKQLSEELGEELESAEYTVSDIEEQTKLAVDFVEENPKQAQKIALGLEKPPQDILESAISIAYADKMKEQGNFKDAFEAERARSLRQTQRGKEIVMERGRFGVNSPEFFVKQVISGRIAKLGKKRIVFMEDGKSARMRKSSGMEVISEKAKTLKKQITGKERKKIANVQSFIDSITC